MAAVTSAAPRLGPLCLALAVRACSRVCLSNYDRLTHVEHAPPWLSQANPMETQPAGNSAAAHCRRTRSAPRHVAPVLPSTLLSRLVALAAARTRRSTGDALCVPARPRTRRRWRCPMAGCVARRVMLSPRCTILTGCVAFLLLCSLRRPQDRPDLAALVLCSSPQARRMPTAMMRTRLATGDAVCRAKRRSVAAARVRPPHQAEPPTPASAPSATNAQHVTARRGVWDDRLRRHSALAVHLVRWAPGARWVPCKSMHHVNGNFETSI